MPLHRYYSDRELTTGSVVTLTDVENHHLVRVVRAVEGQNVEIVNGRGVLATATVHLVKGSLAQLEVTDIQHAVASSRKLILVQALPRIPRLDFIIEKATELGVDQIILFPAVKSERPALSAQQQQRCQMIAVNAMKQCGRLFLPELVCWPKISKWPVFTGRGYFGDVNPQAAPLWQILCASSQPADVPLAFCVGPESGLTDAEEATLVQLGWQGVKLHTNILRTDTAPLVALSLLSQLGRVTN
jgi:16S rRNA (uracil1498-N3)-methyltransferase